MPIRVVLRSRPVAVCAAVVVAISATISMLEPVLPLFLTEKLGIGPARIGLIFGSGAVASTILHPIYGRLADRWGGRRLMMTGLLLVACVLPLLTLTWSYPSTIGFFVLNTMAIALVITPSLAFMAEAASSAGVGSFGVGYGLYNMAWGAGLLGGPAIGGFVFERIGFARLTLAWAPVLVVVTLLLARVQSPGPQGGSPMRRIRTIAALTLTGFVLSSYSLRADVRADQKSHVEFAGMLGRMVNMFGGKAAREGVTSTVAVKGDRKATMNDATGQIIDLAEEKVYDLDLKKKSYKVTTFAELRRRMEEAQKKADEDARKEAGRDKDKPAASDPNAKQMEIDFDVKNTGAKKTINGFDTHEAVMTITVREKGKTVEQGGGMVLTSDLWLAPKIAAMKEIADFDVRYAQKLYGTMLAGVSAEQMAAAMAMYPMMKQALGKMSAEGGKIDGTAIQTTTTMDTVKSAEQIAEETKAGENEGKASASGGAGGLLGGFAKKMAQKKMGGDDAAKPRATFMTLTSEVLKVVTDVAPADVAVPAGFKENKRWVGPVVR